MGAHGQDNLTVSPVKSGSVEYYDKLIKDKDKELLTKPSYTNVGGGPSVFFAYTKTNGVAGDNGEGATCFYS